MREDLREGWLAIVRADIESCERQRREHFLPREKSFYDGKIEGLRTAEYILEQLEL